MSQSLLHEFDLALCTHVRTNLHRHLTRHGQHADKPRKSDRTTSKQCVRAGARREDPVRKYTDLPPADGFALWLSDTLPPKLWSYIKDAASPPFLLTEEHFDALASTLEVMPPILPSFDWFAFPLIHANYTDCLPEMRQRLAGPTADKFAAASLEFAARLEVEGLRIWEGIKITAEWVGEVRHRLSSMGMAELLPRPEGRQPTPDFPDELLPHDLASLVDPSFKNKRVKKSRIKRVAVDPLIYDHLLRHPYDTAETTGKAAGCSTGFVAASAHWKLNQKRLRLAKKLRIDPAAIALNERVINEAGGNKSTQRFAHEQAQAALDQRLDEQEDLLEQRIREYQKQHPGASVEEIAKVYKCTAGDVERIHANRNARLEELVREQHEDAAEDEYRPDADARGKMRPKWHEKKA